MERLSLDTFIGAADDPELSQYKVLAALKIYSDMLHKNKLYPSFGDLVEVINSINQLQHQKAILDEMSPKSLKGFDYDKNELIFESPEDNSDRMKSVFDFISWAMPKINELIEEGKAIFDFVDANTQIAELGIMPLYNKEGYFLLVDGSTDSVNVFRYEMYLIGSKKDPLTTLRTKFLYKLENEIAYSLAYEVIKLNLIEKYPDLPNPALYKIDNETGFPFDETVLPVAKRKLIQKLAA